jgi:aminoglycoside/choline kinase family phosphotransferase
MAGNDPGRSGYPLLIELVEEWFTNEHLKAEITAALRETFGTDTRVTIIQALPGMTNRVGTRRDWQARQIVGEILRRYGQEEA